jgi:hypothetical protein
MMRTISNISADLQMVFERKETFVETQPFGGFGMRVIFSWACRSCLRRVEFEDDKTDFDSI